MVGFLPVQFNVHFFVSSLLAWNESGRDVWSCGLVSCLGRTEQWFGWIPFGRVWCGLAKNFKIRKLKVANT